MNELTSPCVPVTTVFLALFISADKTQKAAKHGWLVASDLILRYSTSPPFISLSDETFCSTKKAVFDDGK